MTHPMTVWLASYPRSGNTWMRAMLNALTSEEEEPHIDLNALRGGPIASSRDHLERWIGFASSDLAREELATIRPLCDAALDRALGDVRFRKIHDALRATPDGAPIVPPDRTRGAIYLVRDPRDVAVSYAHHAGQTHEWAVTELADGAASMLGEPGVHDPQVPMRLGTWSGHVREWTEHDLFPVLVVRYEDMSADPLGQLTRVARFAGIDAGEDRLVASVHAARFDALRAQEDRSGFNARPARDRAFFRRGEAGAWRAELAAELAARVERDHGEVMSKMGYEIDVRAGAASS